MQQSSQPPKKKAPNFIQRNIERIAAMNRQNALEEQTPIQQPQNGTLPLEPSTSANVHYSSFDDLKSPMINTDAQQEQLMMPQKSLLADENTAPRDEVSVTENSPFAGKMANTAQIHQVEQISTVKSPATVFYSCGNTPQDTVEVAEEAVSPAPRNPFAAIVDGIRSSQKKVIAQDISPQVNEMDQPVIENMPSPITEMEPTNHLINTTTPQPEEGNRFE